MYSSYLVVKKPRLQIRIGLYCLTLTIFKLELNDKPWPAIIHYVAKNPDSKSINGGFPSLTDMYMLFIKSMLQKSV